MNNLQTNKIVKRIQESTVQIYAKTEDYEKNEQL